MLKVFTEDGRIFAWEKSAWPKVQDLSASIETCTSGGKVSERNSGVEIWERHHEIIFRDALQHIYHPNGNKGCIYYTN